MSHINIINQFVSAARNGDENTVFSLLLNSKVNINDKDIDGYTASIIAAINDYENIVSPLLDRGADINIINYDADTSVIHAVRYSNKSMVSLLLDKGADTILEIIMDPLY